MSDERCEEEDEPGKWEERDWYNGAEKKLENRRWRRVP
jgi:hypothetical protein